MPPIWILNISMSTRQQLLNRVNDNWEEKGKNMTKNYTNSSVSHRVGWTMSIFACVMESYNNKIHQQLPSCLYFIIRINVKNYLEIFFFAFKSHNRSIILYLPLILPVYIHMGGLFLYRDLKIMRHADILWTWISMHIKS